MVIQIVDGVVIQSFWDVIVDISTLSSVVHVLVGCVFELCSAIVDASAVQVR